MKITWISDYDEGTAASLLDSLKAGDSFAQAWQTMWRKADRADSRYADFDAIYASARLAWNTWRKQAHDRLRDASNSGGRVSYPGGEESDIFRSDLAIVRNGAKAEPNRTLNDMLAEL